MDTGAYMENQMDNLIESGIREQEWLWEQLKCFVGDDMGQDPNDLHQKPNNAIDTGCSF